MWTTWHKMSPGQGWIQERFRPVSMTKVFWVMWSASVSDAINQIWWRGYTRGIFSISPLDGVKTLVDVVGPHPGKTWEPCMGASLRRWRHVQKVRSVCIKSCCLVGHSSNIVFSSSPATGSDNSWAPLFCSFSGSFWPPWFWLMFWVGIANGRAAFRSWTCTTKKRLGLIFCVTSKQPVNTGCLTAGVCVIHLSMVTPEHPGYTPPKKSWVCWSFCVTSTTGQNIGCLTAGVCVIHLKNPWSPRTSRIYTTKKKVGFVLLRHIHNWSLKHWVFDSWRLCYPWSPQTSRIQTLSYRTHTYTHIHMYLL